jgi:hypothetical protein
MSRPSKEFMIDKLVEDMESWPEDELLEYAQQEMRENLKVFENDQTLIEMCQNNLPEGWEEEFWQ